MQSLAPQGIEHVYINPDGQALSSANAGGPDAMVLTAAALGGGVALLALGLYVRRRRMAGGALPLLTERHMELTHKTEEDIKDAATAYPPLASSRM